MQSSWTASSRYEKVSPLAKKGLLPPQISHQIANMDRRSSLRR